MTESSTFEERFAMFVREYGGALPITEPQLEFGSVCFKDPAPGQELPSTLEIVPTDRNMKSRFIFQCLISDGGVVTNDVRTEAAILYGEALIKDANLHPENHPFIVGLLNYDTFIAEPNPEFSSTAALQQKIENLWEDRDNLTPAHSNESDEAAAIIGHVLDLLDEGQFRVAEKINGEWVTRDWLKKACLLYFRVQSNEIMEGGVLSWDKVDLKCAFWNESDFSEAGFRMVPGAIVRRSAFVARNVVLMAGSFVNMGAYVDEGTMIDTGARVGSCAQVGKKVHLGAGSGIGGVFEPLQATPTIIEDGVFIGALCEVAEGCIVEEGAVLAMGCHISASTPIVDRETGEIFFGRVPSYSVVVPGSIPDPKSTVSGLHKDCVIIVKKVNAQTRLKTSTNDLLRE